MRPHWKHGCRVFGSHPGPLQGPPLLHRGSAFFCKWRSVLSSKLPESPLLKPHSRQREGRRLPGSSWGGGSALSGHWPKPLQHACCTSSCHQWCLDGRAWQPVTTFPGCGADERGGAFGVEVGDEDHGKVTPQESSLGAG